MADNGMATEVKCIITGLLTSSPLKCTIKQLCNDFTAMVGYNIPFRQLGFQDIEQYLLSIPDTVRVIGYGNLAEVEGVIKPKSAHINEMVTSQKKTSIPSHKKKLLRSRRSRWGPPVRNEPLTSSPQSSPLPHRYLTPSPTYSPPPNHISPPPNQISLPPASSKNLPSAVPSSSNIAPQELRQANVNALTQGSRVTPPSSGNPSYSDEGYLAASSCSTDDYFKSKIPREIENNLRKLIGQFPDGICCTKIPSEYRKSFKRSLNFEYYNYRSLIEMLSDLPDIFHYQKISTHDFILYDKNRPVPSLGQNEKPSIDYVTEFTSNFKENDVSGIPPIDWSSMFIPNDVMHLSDTIPRYFVGDDLQVGDFVDVNIGEIYDPSKFWLYKTFGGLDELMKKLQKFFAVEKNKYTLPEVLLTESLYCVSRYYNEFHRAVIVNLLPKTEGFVKVLFIDYGTVAVVAVSEIWYLPKQFAQEPCQAIRTRLSNIYPSIENSIWSVDCINRFRELITNSILVAEITNIDYEDNIIEVYLADIGDQRNIFYINDVLVKEGWAIYTDQERIKGHVDPCCTPAVPYIHLYPEFDRIESGYTPTLEDMNFIVACKIPLHHYMPQYFDIVYHEDKNHTKKLGKEFAQIKPDLPMMTRVQFNINLGIDYSIFPKSLKSQIRDIVNKKIPDCPKVLTDDSAKKNVELVSEAECDKSNDSSKEFKEYSCSKRRISELINGSYEITNNELWNESEITPLSNEFRVSANAEQENSFDDEIRPMDKKFKQLNLNESSNSGMNNFTRTFKAWNPFIDNDSPDFSKLYHPTNPFLKDILTTSTSNKILEDVSKPSNESPWPNFQRNLNSSYKTEKYTNNYSEETPEDTSTVSSETNTFSDVSVIGKSMKLLNIHDSNTDITRPKVVRTPPGFESRILPNNAWNVNNFVYPRVNHPYVHYNPYFQVQGQYNNYYPPQQFSAPLPIHPQNYVNNPPVFAPNHYGNYQYDMRYFQQMAGLHFYDSKYRFNNKN